MIIVGRSPHNNVKTYRSVYSAKPKREYYERLRKAAYDAYGNCCICCGETQREFLEIDHTNGGGNKHRKAIGSSILLWLKRNNYPPEFRILCANCNRASGLKNNKNRECPHTKNLNFSVEGLGC